MNAYKARGVSFTFTFTFTSTTQALAGHDAGGHCKRLRRARNGEAAGCLSLSLSLARRSLSLSLSLSVLTTSHFSHLSACSRVQSAFALLLPQQKAASRRRSMVSWRFSAESTSMALAASLLPQRCASCTGLSPKCVAIVASAPYSKRARIISVLALFAAAESPRW
jgi:hypothetical protein